jgi:hypothetical protein
MTGTLISNGAVQARPAILGVLANDTDPGGLPLTTVLVSGPSNAATFTLNADGTFNYTSVPNYNGTYTFTYRADDGIGNSNTATVTITVNSINDAPAGTNNALPRWKTPPTPSPPSTSASPIRTTVRPMR